MLTVPVNISHSKKTAQGAVRVRIADEGQLTELNPNALCAAFRYQADAPTIHAAF